MTKFSSLDAHARPPENIRPIFKNYQKLKTSSDFDLDADITDPNKLIDANNDEQNWRRHTIKVDYGHVFRCFLGDSFQAINEDSQNAPIAFESRILPGLLVFPALIPPAVQLKLLGKIFHRDLTDRAHSTNVHLHHHVSFNGSCESTSEFSAKPRISSSVFSIDPSQTFLPKDPSIHKPMTVKDFLDKRLRWVTLGGQYNWTTKSYPATAPPAFPADIKSLIEGLFPEMEAQAAIVNFYSPGDTLSVHRDVSEECDRGLVSISLGCDGTFLICNDKTENVVTLRLRSGDTVFMSGEARFAWHGVPSVLAGTCPHWLRSWPSGYSEETRGEWEGWISNKRINLNVRQMADSPGG